MWAMNAEGWSAAIGALGIGIGIFIVRTAPALAGAIKEVAPAVAEAIRQIGTARAEVRGRMQRELTTTTAKVEAIEGQVAQAKAEAERQIALAKAEADRKHDAIVAEIKEDADRKYRALRAQADDAARRRKHDRELQQRMIFRLEEQVRHQRDTDAKIEAGIEPRVARNEAAIDAIAQETQIPVPPAPEVAGGEPQ